MPFEDFSEPCLRLQALNTNTISFVDSHCKALYRIYRQPTKQTEFLQLKVASIATVLPLQKPKSKLGRLLKRQLPINGLHGLGRRASGLYIRVHFTNYIRVFPVSILGIAIIIDLSRYLIVEYLDPESVGWSCAFTHLYSQKKRPSFDGFPNSFGKLSQPNSIQKGKARHSPSCSS